MCCASTHQKLERAGFRHEGLVEIDAGACTTLRHNRPGWLRNVIQADIKTFDGRPYAKPPAGRIDLLAAGLPCPPFSVAGKQRGEADERNLFPAAFRIIEEV